MSLPNRPEFAAVFQSFEDVGGPQHGQHIPEGAKNAHLVGNAQLSGQFPLRLTFLLETGMQVNRAVFRGYLRHGVQNRIVILDRRTVADAGNDEGVIRNGEFASRRCPGLLYTFLDGTAAAAAAGRLVCRWRTTRLLSTRIRRVV